MDQNKIFSQKTINKEKDSTSSLTQINSENLSSNYKQKLRNKSCQIIMKNQNLLLEGYLKMNMLKIKMNSTIQSSQNESNYVSLVRIRNNNSYENQSPSFVKRLNFANLIMPNVKN